jgi:hypothetical protein
MSLLVLNKTLKNSWTNTFIVTLIFLVLASALFWLDYFRAYETEVKVLFVTKENQPAPVVADAMGSIMTTLTFATRADVDFSHLTILLDTDSKDDQKTDWNKNISVTTTKGSSVLTFSQKGVSEEESREKTAATLKTLMLATNLYYDKEHEVELRIIDKPITKLVMGSVVGYGLTVLATAATLTTLFFVLLWVLTSKKIGVREQLSVEGHIGESVAWIDPKKFVAVRPETLNFQTAKNEKVIQKQASRVVQKVAHAPGNLPIMEGALPQFGIEEVDLVTETILPEVTTGAKIEEIHIPTFDTTEEPTVEEYKRRLNELLKGKSL